VVLLSARTRGGKSGESELILAHVLVGDPVMFLSATR
jgi:hypothetical protein